MKMEGAHFVEKMDYNLLTMESCKEKKQPMKDMAYLIIFGILTLVWLNIGIYGFLAGSIPSEIVSDIDVWNDNRMMQALSSNKYLLVGFTALAVVLIVLFLIMIARMPKFMIYGVLCCQLAYLITATIGPGRITFYYATQLLPGFVIFGIKIYAFRKVGMKTLCKVVQDAVRALNCFPSSMIIVLLEFVVELSVVIFTVTAGAYLLFIKKTSDVVDYANDKDYSKRFSTDEDNSNAVKYTSSQRIANADPPTYVICLLSIFICVAISILCFIGNFRRMLLHGIFAHWYRASDKKNISNALSLRYFATIVRNHMGTIAYSSTIFAVVPVIRALFNSGKDLLRLIYNHSSSLYALWYALWESTTNASIMCISNGTSMYQSTKDGLQLVMRNPLKYIILRGVTFGLIEFGALLVLFINVNAEVHLYDVSLRSDQYLWFKPTSSIVVGILSLVISAIYLIIFNNAAEAVIICFFEESNTSKKIEKDGDYLCENNEAC